jgi:hypothetical protein
MAISENNTTHVASGEFLGKDLEFLNQTFPSSVAAKTAKDSTIDVVEKTIQIYANIVGAGPLVNSNVEKNYIVEGTDQFVGSPASSGGTFTLTTSSANATAGTLATAVQALGTVDSINMGSETSFVTNLAMRKATLE